MTIRQRAQLFHELAKLIGAGLHLDRSVALLIEQQPAPAVKAWLNGVQKGLMARLSLADAVATHTKSTALENALLAAGERGGRIESACAHLANYYELRQKSQDRARGALIYPLVLLHFGLVLPEVPRILADGVGTVLWRIVLHVLLAWGLLGGMGLGLWQMVKLAGRSAAADRLLQIIPLFGGMRRHWALARFCQVFETGLLAALRVTETLRLAGEASQSALLHEAGQKAAALVESGAQLGSALKSTGDFPKVFVQSVTTAEEAGTLDHEMQRWANAEAELAAQAQDRIAEWVPRALYLLIVLYVAARILGMASGIYEQYYKPMLDM